MFMKQMDNEFVRDSEGSWVAPLPFRVPRQPLPSNRQQALHRANMLDASLNRNPVKREHFSYIYDPSPAVATLGPAKAAQASELEFGSHVTSFVTRDFYVDDGRTSCPTKEEDVKLMKDTQQALAKYGNLRLHKFASNCAEVMFAFHASDLASNLKDLDLECDSKPLTRSIGLSWDVNTDNFLFQLSSENKPITRRGILSTINSLYDPLGFLSRDTLIAIETLRIPRTYVPYLSKTTTKELHVFSDASEKAIAAVAYLRTIDSSGEPNIGFILGKTKVAPTSGQTN
ncbi:Hypothetical predicted protein [Mytilus galloprovincialis]|uniref:Uncharacterized protein n=1 Tax=Mytilus galloprovincialis TaxID=29158 RepID=A0A8B6BTS8_MYTGA|nr:Hypothetical predicted protein [Mytilus galloprovincialis]